MYYFSSQYFHVTFGKTKKKLKLAAIDIGSNAIRLQITNVIESQNESFFKRVEYVRFPMRLGHDVFTNGRLSQQQRDKFIQLMKAFKILIDLYEVTDHMACATSAMREASNGKSIIQQVKEETGLEINVIPGEIEAKMIKEAIQDYLGSGAYIHIDVGGGSTELNLFKNGEKYASASFKIGSVRVLENFDTDESWEEMKNWVLNNIDPELQITAVGTGGNINKFLELSGKKPGKLLHLEEIQDQQEYIRSLSMEDRQIKLKLNPDRADVIVPASEIYLKVMRWANAKQILIPDVGLKDGVMKLLYQRQKDNNSTIKVL